MPFACAHATWRWTFYINRVKVASKEVEKVYRKHVLGRGCEGKGVERVRLFREEDKHVLQCACFSFD